MGVTRKFLSACTLGLVDFRSDKERTARSARKTLHQVRQQNRWEKRQARSHRPVAVRAGAQGWAGAEQPAAGWFPDPRAGGSPAMLRWWDGRSWTGWTATVYPPSG